MKLTPTMFKYMLKNFYFHDPPVKYCLAVDFDGTLCYSNYPDCGDETPIAKWVRAIQSEPENDFITIITTCRDGNKSVDYAKDWLKEHNIHWDYFNENDPARIELYKDCRKIYCDMLIDNCAWGFDINDYILEECR